MLYFEGSRVGVLMERVGSVFTNIIRAGEKAQAIKGLHEGSSLFSRTHNKKEPGLCYVLVTLALETG